MSNMKPMRLIFACILLLCSCVPAAKSDDAETARIRAKIKAIPMNEKVKISNEEWKKVLKPEQYRVLRESGTETPFHNAYWDNHEKGEYFCAACGNALFLSDTKFESGTGWPSFYAPVTKGAVAISTDDSLGMSRDEVSCARCGSHLGHVFPDGPAPTGERFCMNSVSLDFQKGKPGGAAAEMNTEKAIFAAGCFWGVQDKFDKTKGVLKTTVGYTGGKLANPTYEDVCSHTTGHAEAVEVEFDPAIVTYDQLLEQFWKMHDPSQKDGQGPDIGDSYRSAIFYTTPEQKTAAEASKQKMNTEGGYNNSIVTEVTPAKEFYAAEDYHQHYLQRQGFFGRLFH